MIDNFALTVTQEADSIRYYNWWDDEAWTNGFQGLPGKPRIDLIEDYSITVRIDMAMKKKIAYLLAKFPSDEWSGPAWFYPVRDENGDIEEFLLIDFTVINIGISDKTEWNKDHLSKSGAAVKFMQKHIADDRIEEMYMGNIHSHHSMTTFFSADDKEALRDMLPPKGCFPSLIVSTKEPCVSFAFSRTTDAGKPEYIEVPACNIIVPLPEVEDNLALEAEIDIAMAVSPEIRDKAEEKEKSKISNVNMTPKEKKRYLSDLYNPPEGGYKITLKDFGKTRKHLMKICSIGELEDIAYYVHVYYRAMLPSSSTYALDQDMCRSVLRDNDIISPHVLELFKREMLEGQGKESFGERFTDCLIKLKFSITKQMRKHLNDLQDGFCVQEEELLMYVR